MKPESYRLDTRRAFRAGCEGGAEGRFDGRADASIMRPDFAGVASDRGPAAATP